MLEYLLLTVVSFIITFLTMPVIILIAAKKKLYDLPNERKVHTKKIASLGGIGIFMGMFFSILFAGYITKSFEFFPFLASIFIMFFTGLKDDVIALTARTKFLAQFIAVGIIIHFGGLHIESFYGLFGLNAVPDTISYPLTYFVMILIVNAYNLIDGVDGLAGSLGVLAASVFGIYFYFSGESIFAFTAFCLAASLLAFLIFNFNPARIFMGDSGSLVLGMMMAIFAMKFLSTSVSSVVIPTPANVAIVISILIIPIVDTLRVFTIRILKGRSPFHPDKNHIHHLLIKSGFSHSGIVITCIAFNLIVIGLSYTLGDLGNNIVLGILSIFSLSAIAILYYHSANQPEEVSVVHQTTKVEVANTIKALSIDEMSKKAVKN